MNCPACGNSLTNLNVQGVILDACSEACGGIWFDNFELKKLAQPPTQTGQPFQWLQPKVKVDFERKRLCPRCPDQPLMRHFSSRTRTVEIDTCPGCNGCWLDAGEIYQILSEQNDPRLRKQAVQNFMDTTASSCIDNVRTSNSDVADGASRALWLLAGY